MKHAETGIQLQSIVKPDREICPVEEMYFHRQGRLLLFDGYFNLFHIEKWKRYTGLERLSLSIRTEGFRKLFLYHDRTCISEVLLEDMPEERLEEGSGNGGRTDGGASRAGGYEIPFPWESCQKGVFWFALLEQEGAERRTLSGFYTGECRHCMDVEIGIAICTFHREAYVERNLKQLRDGILNNHRLQAAGHLWVYLADNGGTLEEYEPVRAAAAGSGGRIRILPGRNTGGAGGFTRGMLQILSEKEEKKLTHVLLMDDDALPEPDVFVRVYGFLRVRKEAWKDITMGGAMLQEERPYVLHCAGEYWKKGIIKSPGRGMDLRLYKNAAGQELLSVDNEKKYYSGWWCCCYSLNTVREDNLPLPVFLHHDDIEFGMRNRRYGIVFLNGVSVWHRSVGQKVPVTNLYYDIRNNLIETALQYPPGKAARIIRRFLYARAAARLVIYRPQELVMILKGWEDFLKGPRWLWEQDAEQLHLSLKEFLTGKVNMCKVLLQIFFKRNETLKAGILSYQKYMHQYTDRHSWEEYFRRNQL